MKSVCLSYEIQAFCEIGPPSGPPRGYLAFSKTYGFHKEIQAFREIASRTSRDAALKSIGFTQETQAFFVKSGLHAGTPRLQQCMVFLRKYKLFEKSASKR